MYSMFAWVQVCTLSNIFTGPICHNYNAIFWILTNNKSEALMNVRYAFVNGTCKDLQKKRPLL